MPTGMPRPLSTTGRRRRPGSSRRWSRSRPAPRRPSCRRPPAPGGASPTRPSTPCTCGSLADRVQALEDVMALASYDAAASPVEELRVAGGGAWTGCSRWGCRNRPRSALSGTARAGLVGRLPERLRHVALVSLDQRCSASSRAVPTIGAGLSSSLPVALTSMGVCGYLSPHVPPRNGLARLPICGWGLQTPHEGTQRFPAVNPWLLRSQVAARGPVRGHDEAGIRPAKAAPGRPNVMSLTCARRGGKSPRITPYVSPGPVLPGARSGP
ncbi:hypothetical protein STENM223S_06624 [Streptomyces tendae]